MANLTADQRRAMTMLATSKSFAVFGAAGTGKSVVRDHIARKIPHALLGPTGMSMAGTRGTTVAKFLRAKPATIRSAGALARSMSSVPRVEGFSIIIDEAPMVATTEILALDQGLKSARGSKRPFGGVRIIIFGDFCQLTAPETTTPLFEIEPYRLLDPDIVVLTTQMRQHADPQLELLLADCRKGRLSTPSADLLLYKLNARPASPDAVWLCATRAETTAINKSRLEALGGELLHGLKLGAKVIVTRNIYQHGKLLLVNGDSGVVTKLQQAAVWIKVRGTTHRLKAPPPLGLAFALTIHKAQGQTYDNVVVVGTKIFAAGQLYVALSRATSLAGICCKDVVPEQAEIPRCPRIERFLNQHNLV